MSWKDNGSFSKKIPKLQLFWDPTSLGRTNCWERYHLKAIMGYTQIRGRENDDTFFGTAFHDATEKYDREILKGTSFKESVELAVQQGLVSTWNKDEGRPWIPTQNYKTRETLIRSVVGWCDKYKDSKVKIITMDNKIPAIEVPFKIDLNIRPKDSDETYVLCGYQDRIVNAVGPIMSKDTKTTKFELDKFYFSNFNFDIQFLTYDFAMEISFGIKSQGVMVDAVQLLVSETRYKREIIKFTEYQRELWYRDLISTLQTAEYHARMNHWPKNTKACGWGDKRCEFYGVCSAKTPEEKNYLLKNDFTQTMWDPSKEKK